MSPSLEPHLWPRLPRGIEPERAVVHEEFLTRSGPGGQNVNRVATACRITFDPALCPGLSPQAAGRLRALAPGLCGADGCLHILAQTHRTQMGNRQEARQRLARLLLMALPPPRHRRATRPTQNSVERRLQAKTRRSFIKRSRRAPHTEPGD